VIVNTCGWVEGVGYEVLVHLIKAFDGILSFLLSFLFFFFFSVIHLETHHLPANVILVLGHERVYADLLSEFQDSPALNILKLPKSGGVVVREPRYRRKARGQRIKEYFYGKAGAELYPQRRVVPFHEVEIYQLTASIAPVSALPIGGSRTLDEARCVPVLPSSDLDHAILGVTQPKTGDAELNETNLLGFVWV